MKLPRYFFMFAIVVGTISITLFLLNRQDPVSASLAQATITLAPTRTPGPPIGSTPRPYPTLAQSLDTEQLALTRALEVDSQTALWRSTSWTIDTLRLEPDRITIKWYSDRTYDGSSYAPDAETGPVWVVTVKGGARFKLPGMAFDTRRTYDEVTYIIAQKTGDLLGVRLGPPSKDQPFLPNTVAPPNQAASPGTPSALSASSCTQNPAGLSVRVSQQPGKSTISDAAGPVYSFSVEGNGFIPGENITIVLKGRTTATGTVGSTSETVLSDSTFATSIGAAVTQSNMQFDLFVIHRRGVACTSLTVAQ